MSNTCDRCKDPVDMASKHPDDRAAIFPGLFFGHKLCFGITLGVWVLTQDDREQAIRIADSLERQV